MDAKIIPSDVLGIIFSQLDLKGMVSLALTCRRFLSLFNLYPASILFGNNWTFEHICHPSQLVRGTLVYTGPPHTKFLRDFDASRNHPVETQRLCDVIDFAKSFVKFNYLPRTSTSIDYFINGLNKLKQPRRYHVFKLFFDDRQITYTQYHRTGKPMIIGKVTGVSMTSCQYIDKRGVTIFSIRGDSPSTYTLMSHLKDGTVREWIHHSTHWYRPIHFLVCDIEQYFTSVMHYRHVIPLEEVAGVAGYHPSLDHIASIYVRRHSVVINYM